MQIINTLLLQKFALFLFIFMIFIAISERNLLRKIIFLNISQSSLIFLFIIKGFNVYPSTVKSSAFYSSNVLNSSIVDPVPQALMLTAIVVGFSISAIAISLIIRLKKSFGTIEEDHIENAIINKDYFKQEEMGQM